VVDGRHLLPEAAHRAVRYERNFKGGTEALK
jgi:hypothetical protein